MASVKSRIRSLSITPRTYRGITLFVLLALAFIIVSGASVRLTGSGLGCSDWPNCEPGRLVAPVEYHALVEFVNRMVTGLVSVAVIAAVLGSLLRRPRRRDLIYLSAGLVAGVIAQIVLGGLTVIFELRPPFVMGHFLLSMVLVWNAVLLHYRAGRPDTAPRRAVSPHLLHVVRAVYVAAAVVVFTGTVVTASGPHGGDEDAQRFDVALPDVTRVHTGAVILLVILVLILAWFETREPGGERLVPATRALLLLLLAQATVGYVQYFNELPPLLVGIHVAGAVSIWSTVVFLSLRCTERPSPETSASAAAEVGSPAAVPPAVHA
ncbi:MAG: COX15/CtaA family protein [Acidimicrobiia bacterium]|nr:COX15/CtaA family protein [Acidimicrobiia bacterium]